MLTQYVTPDRVISWTSFSHLQMVHGFCRNFQCFAGFVHYLFCLFILIGVEFPLCLAVILSLNAIICF